MQKEKIIIPFNKDFSIYEKYNLNTFLLPLKDYGIGFDYYYDVEEINKLSKDYNIYVLVNKVLHRKVDSFRELYPSFDKSVKFIVEDIGLNEVIEPDRFILYENHILSNYKAINYLDSVGIHNVVINNDLTIEELEDIVVNTKSNLYYFYYSNNMLMYSRRNLVSNYDKSFGVEHTNTKYEVSEKVSHMKLFFNEEEEGTIVRNGKVFCASKYKDGLEKLNLIYDLTMCDNLDLVLSNIDSENLCDLVESDYYFLENEIKYKVGDLK